MKTETILSQIGVPSNGRTREAVQTLIAIYKMLLELKKTHKIKVVREPQEISFGRTVGAYIRDNGTSIPGECWEVTTENGRYKQYIPTNNDLHRAFCQSFGQTVAIDKPDYQLIFDPSQSKVLKQVAGFCCKDKHREQFRFIRLKLSKDGLCTRAEAVATDIFRVIRKTFFIPQVPFEGVLLLDPSAIKTGLNVIDIFPKFYRSAGQTYSLSDYKYPDVDYLFQAEAGNVTVNKKAVVRSVKMMDTITDRVTRKVDLHFNGAVFISADNSYFGNKSNSKIMYEQKTMPDFNASFNAKLLLSTIATIEKDEIVLQRGAGRAHSYLLNDDVVLMELIPNE